jgi:hypothetical protein
MYLFSLSKKDESFFIHIILLCLPTYILLFASSLEDEAFFLVLRVIKVLFNFLLIFFIVITILKIPVFQEAIRDHLTIIFSFI